MRIILGTLLKRVTLAASPILLSACLFSVDPLLDETNSLSGEESDDVKSFVEASHLAYDGIPGQALLPMIPFFEKETSTGELSVIRVAQLGSGMLLVQQKLQECISDHCFVYYGARIVTTWWPDICLAETEADEAQDALRALASGYGVKVTLIGDNDKAPPDFGVDGPRDRELDFLRAQFTEGRLNCSLDEGLTELHGAAAMGAPTDIAELIEAGADVNVRDHSDRTPLHFAAYYGNPANIAALIEAGAEISTRDTEGATPLHWAARRGSPEAIVVLIEAGADVNARMSGDHYSGATPLHNAAEVENAGTIAALVAAGADVNARDKNGGTPLHTAAQSSAPASVEALLDAGADGSLKDNDGETPFDLAERMLHPKFDRGTTYTRLEKAQHK